MKLINMLPEGSDSVSQLIKKLAPPMVTLLSAEPEIQYVALRNINLIVQKRPDILKQEMKVFFVKYNDPIYVKMEKVKHIYFCYFSWQESKFTTKLKIFKRRV